MLDEYKDFFERTFHFEPYGHQLQTLAALAQGKSVILRAPTGSGKTEAALAPYLWHRKGGSFEDGFPGQMVYSLPMRSLVDQISHKAADIVNKMKPRLRVAGHHGKMRMSPFFREDIIVTTIDQTISAYCCTPPGLPGRHAAIPAGPVAGGYLVFDEVHVFDPLRSLQSVLLIVEQSRKWDLPFLVMTATIPDQLLKWAEDKWKESIEIIDVEEEKELRTRRERKVTAEVELGKGIFIKEVIEGYENSKDGKIIVVVNRVDKAQGLYNSLAENNDLSGVEIGLLHSRFIENDRRGRGEWVTEMFGKVDSGKRGNSYYRNDKPAILIATQVIEVGMDISCRTMLTEVAPIDALIQRAGRVARWGGEGVFRIFNTSYTDDYPYVKPSDLNDNAKFLERTRLELKKVKEPFLLSWEKELGLVNGIIGPAYDTDNEGNILDPSFSGRVLHTLREGSYKGKPELVHSAIRELSNDVSISIHRDPVSLGETVFGLPKLTIPVYKLKQLLNKWESMDKNSKKGIGIYCVVNEGSIKDSEKPVEKTEFCRKIGEKKNDGEQLLRLSNFFILHPDIIGYGSDIGLIYPGDDYVLLDPSWEPIFGAEDKEARKAVGDEIDEPELWVDHSKKVIETARKYIEPYSLMVKKIAEWYGLNEETIRKYVELAAGLHDLGKLNKDWQNAWGLDEIIARACGEYKQSNLPAHATVSAQALYRYFYELTDLGDAFRFAVAQHHGIRAVEAPKYKLIEGWQNEVRAVACFVGLDNPEIDRLINAIISEQPAPTRLFGSFPDITNPYIYRMYALAYRVVKLSDWEATAGNEDFITKMEYRYGKEDLRNG